MAERILFPEWRKQNETIKYPFSSRASLVNNTGRVLVEGTFLDAALYPIGVANGLYLSSVEITFQKVLLRLSATGQPDIATGEFNLVSPPDEITFVDVYGRPAGVLVTEGRRLSLFQSWGVGVHEFIQSQSEFAATCVFPTPEIGVRGIQLEDGTLFIGDVWLVGDDGVVFRHETATATILGTCRTETVQVIRMDIVGDPLFRRRLCQPTDLFTTPRFVRTITIVGPNMTFTLPPDDAGNVILSTINDLASDTVLRIKTTPDGIEIGAVGSVTNSQ